MYNNELNEIAGIKYRLTNLQKQSIVLKQNFFDYIEGLSTEYNALTNLNRTEFSFDIFGSKLKLKTTYDNTNSSYQGKFAVMVQSIINGVAIFDELFSLNFNSTGNVKFSIDKEANFYFNDFAESFYIAMMNKLFESDKFEL